VEAAAAKSQPVKQIEVTILGQSYVLGCPEGGEPQLRAAVEAVDREMSAIRDGGRVKARERIAVLAALNVAYPAGAGAAGFCGGCGGGTRTFSRARRFHLPATWPGHARRRRARHRRPHPAAGRRTRRDGHRLSAPATSRTLRRVRATAGLRPTIISSVAVAGVLFP
jgi:hypothetical protein